MKFYCEKDLAKNFKLGTYNVLVTCSVHDDLAKRNHPKQHSKSQKVDRFPSLNKETAQQSKVPSTQSCKRLSEQEKFELETLEE